MIEQEGILQNVRETGLLLREGLHALMSRYDSIGDVRGKGLFFGVEVVGDRSTREPAPAEAARVREFLRENGVLLGTSGPSNNVIKIRPPLVFGPEQAGLLLDQLDRALAAA